MNLIFTTLRPIKREDEVFISNLYCLTLLFMTWYHWCLQMNYQCFTTKNKAMSALQALSFRATKNICSKPYVHTLSLHEMSARQT